MGTRSGRELRRWTRRRARLRDPAKPADVLTDIYMAGLTLLLGTAIVLGGADHLGSVLATRPDARTGLAPEWLVLLGAFSVIAALTSLTARLGPVALPPARATWWLPLPVDRRGLLRPASLLWSAVAAVTGAVLGAALALTSGGGTAVIVAVVPAGAALAACAVHAVALAQTSETETAHRWARLIADGLLALAPPVVLGFAVVGVRAPEVVPQVTLAVALTAVALLIALTVAVDRRLDRLTDRSLRRRGAIAGEALGAALSNDTRALGRALTASAEPLWRRASRLGPVRRAPRRLVASLSLVTADALLLRRSTRHLVQLLVAACLPAIALAVAAPSPLVVLLLLAVGSYVAALATSEGARRAEAAPMLDALLPIGARAVRRLRLVAPTAVHALWSMTVFAFLGWRMGAEAGPPWPVWLCLGVLAAPAWAAGAVRAAYRPPPDYSAGLVHTPMGSFAPGAVSAVLRGPDVAFLCSAPALIAVLIGTVTPVLLMGQAGLALAAVLLVTSGQRPIATAPAEVGSRSA